MRVGYFQFDPVFGAVARNLDHVSARLGQVDADLIVLPELFATGYQFVSQEEVFQLAEPVPDGATTKRLADMAARRGMTIVAGLPELDGRRCFNSAVVVGPNGFIGCYRKTHLFFEETLWFTPGDSGFQVWDIGMAKVGVMICFDWYYPESARTLALQGAEIIAHPSNLVLPHCPDSMVTRCLENRVFSVTANRIGSEARGGKERLTFIGMSEVVGPRGRILHRAPRETEDLTIVEIDPAEARIKALNDYNDLLRDRRPALYGD
ncbi:MAG: nitrilase-related carbon-nitrogen hydrolase [Nitrospira sp.]|jgi:predicted amidohydrolase|nr:acyltransferase [Nitrospira sp.]HQY59309.1 nitrilase-related carbon-nitrogen hydrolase [Nitrospira sp.]HRA97864.1 nitrilase-related carbon-nitrogen hydrolase [Nitrospira sp.]